MRPPDGCRSRLGQADMADLALGHQFGEFPDGLLDGRVRVDAVLVVQVDVVGAEPLERPFDSEADIGRSAVRAGPAGVGDEAEFFCGQHHLVTAPSDGPADQVLVGEGPVHLGGVEVADAEVERAADGADALFVDASGAGVEDRHAHRAQSDAGDLEPPSDVVSMVMIPRVDMSPTTCGPIGPER